MSSATQEHEDVFALGGVEVDSDRRCVRFRARVARQTGPVHFLLHVRGYKWLREHAGIVSDVRLSDLQCALAALDWRMWNAIWTGELPKDGRGPSPLRIEISWEGRTVDARELVKSGGELKAEDLIFLGSPQFDPIVLESAVRAPCSVCPLYDREKAYLDELFAKRRPAGSYELNPALLAPVGTEVVVKIYEQGD